MTPTALHLQDVSAPTPDLDALATRVGALAASVAAGRTAGDCLEAVRVWDGLRREVDTYSSLVHLRFNQDTTDAGAKAARQAWDEAEPRWTELEVAMKRALLEHPLRPQLEEALGAQAFALWRSDVLAFDPAIKADLARESELGAEYVELLASAELSFGGETLNLSSIQKHRQSGDRYVRHGAERVHWDWFGANAPALDRIFDELVRLRTAMARQLGFDDFTALVYQRMCRVDYDRGDVERLRAAVREHVVPLATEIRRRQAAVLGVERLMAWDEEVHDPKGNPAPMGDHDWMLARARAREMFDAMGDLGPFFRQMDGGGFLDLADRKGKAGGGFCTSFPTHGMPFVYANFNGTKGDVEVFTHEMGHAFQTWKSRALPLTDYLWPTYESAEVHSMSLEFLTWPHMERFFGAERFRRLHLAGAIVFLPYGTAVDHFQHEIYARPDLTPAERHDVWREMERAYLPWRDWGDLTHPAKGGRWQQQRHIYLRPFYYIDDGGTWEPADGQDPEKVLQAGELHFDLHGQKLRGRFVLIRTKTKGDKEHWLLLHKNDDDAVRGWDPRSR